MRFTHPEHPGRSVRLAYCLNLHPADTAEGLLAGLRSITLPLRLRVAPGREFGIGMYLPASLVEHLLAERGRADLELLGDFLVDHALDPFTWNAFPAGGFGTAGLKQRVFEPAWSDVGSERGQYTLGVMALALRFRMRAARRGHVSLSTHTGWHASRSPQAEGRERARAAFRHVDEILCRMQRPLGDSPQGGVRVVLSLEPEPRANCNDTAELVQWRREIGGEGSPQALGTCLDTCHAAVEFEDPLASLERATADGAPLGKIQLTSALALHASRREHLEPLLALDEPRYLHQVTARTGDGELLRVGDLPELRAALDGPHAERWWKDTELRCHFHVPVDRAEVGDSGLVTTRDHADATLAQALTRPERWGTQELHVEIETYTWSLLLGGSLRPGELVDGLEREYLHAIRRLEAAGWRPA